MRRLISTLLVLAVACGGDEDAPAVGPCHQDAECAGAHLCLFGSCSVICKKDRDCAPGARCLSTAVGAACVSNTSAVCSGSCPPGTVCSGGQCRSTCDTVKLPCLDGQACAGSVCVGMDPAHDPGGAGSGGAAGAGGASGKGGGGAGTGASGTGGGKAGASGTGGGGAGATGGGGTGGGGVAGTAGKSGTGGASGNGGAGGGGAAGSNGGAGLTGGALAAGYGNVCATASDGTVHCWGGTLHAATKDPNQVVVQPSPVAGLEGVPFRSLSVNEQICGVSVAGDLHCWGYAGDGATSGDGTTNPPFPKPVAGIGKADEVAVLHRATCARSKGTVSCFGVDNGLLGAGTTTGAVKGIAVVLGVSDAKRLVGADGVACAIRPASGAGRVTCWGTEVPTPTDIPGENDVVDIAIVADRVVVRRSDGTLHGTRATAGSWPPTQAMAAPPVDTVAGALSFCAIRSSDKAVICSEVYKDPLANNPLTVVSGFSPGDPPVDLAVGAGAVYYGRAHACARTVSGKVLCWGWDTFGQIGIGQPSTLLGPQPGVFVPGLPPTLRVSVEELGSVAVATDHTVREWGASSAFGHSAIDQKMALDPQSLPTNPTNVRRVAFADGDAYVVHEDDTLGLLVNGAALPGVRLPAIPGATWMFAFPLNNYDLGLGQKGGVTVLGFYAPQPTDPDSISNGRFANGGVDPGELSTVTLAKLVGIAASARHAVAWDSGGKLFAWGANDAGQAGVPANGGVLTPGDITPAGEIVIDACGGWVHTCAATKSGKVYCWGGGNYGLGGVVGAGHQPRVHATGSGVIGVACSYYGVCAWSATEVSCWGLNQSGQLGDGTRMDSAVPTAVKNLPGAKNVALGGGHACAVTGADKVVCWGAAHGGRLGNGDSGFVKNATQVVGLP